MSHESVKAKHSRRRKQNFSIPSSWKNAMARKEKRVDDWWAMKNYDYFAIDMRHHHLGKGPLGFDYHDMKSYNGKRIRRKIANIVMKEQLELLHSM